MSPTLLKFKYLSRFIFIQEHNKNQLQKVYKEKRGKR
jgi:hypothetical protein